MSNYIITNEKFTELAYKILDEVKKSGHEYQAVLCPLRGGFFLSYFMSKHLNLPMRYLEISSYTGTEQGEFFIGLKPELDKGRFLLCDDIYDSGNTIRKIFEIYKGIELDVACILSKSPEKHEDYIIGEYVEHDRWVDFYWEIQ